MYSYDFLKVLLFLKVQVSVVYQYCGDQISSIKNRFLEKKISEERIDIRQRCMCVQAAYEKFVDWNTHPEEKKRQFP